MPVQLRVDCTQLQVQSAFELELVNARRNTLVFQRGVLFVIKLLKTGLEAKGALLQLAKLLIAHCHVVKDL